MTQRFDTAPLPVQPFFSTPQQRMALARQRYFEDGARPSGLVNEGVIQSWSRCVQAHRDPAERIVFNPVTPSRVHSALARSALLLASAGHELDHLAHTLAGTPCTAILTDAQGVVVHATRSAHDSGDVLLPLARRVGVDLAEEHVGTTAPGLTLRSGEACMVTGGEHFFGCLETLHCAAAPIHDVHGRLAGVLDVSSESQPFAFDAAAVVALAATTIENQLLRVQSTEHIVVHLQTAPSLLSTPLEGLAGVDTRGRIAWVNSAGSRLLGVARGASGVSAEELFGLPASALARMTRDEAARPHRLPSGLQVWLLARAPSVDGLRRGVQVGALASADLSRPVATEAAAGGSPAELATAPASLRDNDRHLIAQTVQACGGNVSQAARQLGVSRGLIYRHLKKPPGPARLS